MSVTVLSQPNCYQCRATERKMEQLGILYSHVDVTLDPDAMKRAVDLGAKATPVVLVETDGVLRDWWSGYRPDKIKGLL